MSAPRPPAGLGDRGRRLWRRLHADTGFDAIEIELVTELCRTVDMIDRLSVAIGQDVTLAAAALVVEQRLQRDLAGRLARQLRLPADSPETHAAARLGARGAAARWGYTPRLKEA